MAAIQHHWVQLVQGVTRSVPADGPCVSSAAVQGIVWAIDDHPLLWRESSAGLLNAVLAADTSAPLCVYDAVMRTTAVKDLRAALVESLPQVAAHVLSRGIRNSGGSAAANDASDAQLVLDIFRAWSAWPLLPAQAKLRLEEHHRYALVAAGGGTVKAGHGGADAMAQPKAEALTSVKRELINKVLAPLTQSKNAALPKKAPTSSGRAGYTSKAAAEASLQALSSSPAAVAAGLAGQQLVQTAQEAVRAGHRDAFSCPYCGVYYDNAEAGEIHERTHIDYRLTHTKQMRLPPPTAEQFVRYNCDHSTGHGTPTFAAPTHAPNAMLGRFESGGGRKKKAADYLHAVPTHASEEHHCAVCHQPIAPQLLDELDRRRLPPGVVEALRGGGGPLWFLKDCVERQDGSVAHVACC